MQGTQGARHAPAEVQVLLVVDDDLRLALPDAFRHQGMGVAAVATAGDAERELERRDFDVALVEAEALGADGSLLSLFRRRQPTIQLIVLVTDLWFPGVTPGLGLVAFDAVVTSGPPDAVAARVLAAHGVRKLHMECLPSTGPMTRVWRRADRR